MQRYRHHEPAEYPPETDEFLTMKKILIVDDCHEIRQLVMTTLDFDEFEVFEAANGAKAIEMAQKHHPDLIIMDVAMPGPIDGIEATRRIKSNPETVKCQIIILTGSRTDRRKEGVAAGACDVLSKPFSPLGLISKMEQLLGIAQ
ncbi:MAG: response regulator [Chitinispirillaceae bacterium]|nr:response regulator [Chitinispirillaceae bacterium]